MFDKQFAAFKKLRPEERQRATILGLVGVIAILGTITFFFSPFHKQSPPVKLAGPQKAALSIDSKMLEKSTASRIETQERELAALRAAVKQNQVGIDGNQQIPQQNVAPTLPDIQEQPDTPIRGSATPLKKSSQKNAQAVAQLPPMPMPRQQSGNQQQFNDKQMNSYPPPPVPAAPMTPKEEIIGAIGHASNDEASAKNKSDDKKKVNPTVYLPPSFMVAHLLTGLNAPVTNGGKSNPVPVLIRVAAPAQLPNEVKMNLKACFVVGEGVGDLSQERALVRIVSLTCLSKNGQSVIDQQITGFVQDADSKAGLSGRVVAKFGATIARAFLGGLAAGLGEALATSQTTNAVSPLGVTTMNPTNFEDVGLQGLGKGFQAAGSEISKFYMDLARQSMPVIEVGNGKKITLVVTKGVNLEIKSFPSVSWY